MDKTNLLERMDDLLHGTPDDLYDSSEWMRDATAALREAAAALRATTGEGEWPTEADVERAFEAFCKYPAHSDEDIPAMIRATLIAGAAPPPPLRDAPHPDDVAVDAFAEAMKEKLAVARSKGRGGWQDREDCPQQRLSDMLRGHVEKGDPRDVANFCMFLWARGEAILPAEPLRDAGAGWTHPALGVVNDAANDARHRGDYTLANALVRARIDLHTALAAHPAPAQVDEADARRYRFLRDLNGDDSTSPYVCGVHGAPMGDAGWLCGESLDEAVDAALTAAAKGVDRG